MVWPRRAYPHPYEGKGRRALPSALAPACASRSMPLNGPRCRIGKEVPQLFPICRPRPRAAFSPWWWRVHGPRPSGLARRAREFHPARAPHPECVACSPLGPAVVVVNSQCVVSGGKYGGRCRQIAGGGGGVSSAAVRVGLPLTPSRLTNGRADALGRSHRCRAGHNPSGALNRSRLQLQLHPRPAGRSVCVT